MSKVKTHQPKRRRVRLLPITVTMLSLFFVIKLNEVYIGSQHLRDVYAVRDSVAADEKKDDKKEEKKDEKSDVKKEEKTAEADAKKAVKADEEKTAEGDKKQADAKKEEGVKAKEDENKTEGEAKKAEGHGEGKEKPVEEPKTFGVGKTTVKEIEELKAKGAQQKYTKTEVDILENLSKRREEIEARDRELEIKSKVLEATEKRINDKLGEMKTLEVQLGKVLAQYNVKQDAQIKSLVKIYEGMKPDEAAKIFNELEMPILLEVISKMSERKVALVLANMEPKRARDVTQELAEKRSKAPVADAPGAVKQP